MRTARITFLVLANVAEVLVFAAGAGMLILAACVAL